MVLFTVLFTAMCALTALICNRFTRYDIDKMTAPAATIVGGLFGLLVSAVIWIITT